ncbi:methyltransferase [Maribellus comscasis]|uniref:Methyltransferase n=1 Tax=Maribellus comscasis TaxID=2681766 RepID=A0A6I6JTR4_9BACT|nr:uroporphyrinogen decarboxylase family protein [Maribellus comscasis]QGY43522.1 methyltransferase [Maribellus comscasis]
MDSRQQFLKTVNHQQPDRIVIDLGSTGVTGIHVQTISQLRRHFGLQRKPIRVIEPFQMLGEVGWELIDSIGIDVVGAWGKNSMFGFYNHAPFKEWKTPWGQRVMVPENFNVTTDENGNTLMHPEGDISVPASAKMPKSGFFFDAIIRQKPIVEEELNVENNLEEFGLITDDELEHWRVEVDKAYFSGKAVIANFGGTALGDIALVPGIQLKSPKGIRDVAEWYMSTITRPDYIKTIFERQVEIAIENLRRIFAVVGNKVNAVFICGTDFGTQTSTFCPPEQFDEMWLPYYKKMNNWIHENTAWKTFKHSCGAVETFMDSFIRAGFDIINPVQINAAGMDPKKLKEKYGNNIIFWGGGVDTQKILPFGKPEEVRKHVLQNCEILNKNGGFIFNTVHNTQANVPAENIVAMLDAIREFNGS